MTKKKNKSQPRTKIKGGTEDLSNQIHKKQKPKKRPKVTPIPEPPTPEDVVQQVEDAVLGTIAPPGVAQAVSGLRDKKKKKGK